MKTRRWRAEFFPSVLWLKYPIRRPTGGKSRKVPCPAGSLFGALTVRLALNHQDGEKVLHPRPILCHDHLSFVWKNSELQLGAWRSFANSPIMGCGVGL